MVHGTPAHMPMVQPSVMLSLGMNTARLGGWDRHQLCSVPDMGTFGFAVGLTKGCNSGSVSGMFWGGLWERGSCVSSPPGSHSLPRFPDASLKCSEDRRKERRRRREGKGKKTGRQASHSHYLGNMWQGVFCVHRLLRYGSSLDRAKFLTSVLPSLDPTFTSGGAHSLPLHC